MTTTPSEGKRGKVALLGCGDTLSLAPFDDHGWEIWSSGQWQETVTRWDAWFEIHDIEALPPSFEFHLVWMAQQEKPIYVMRPSGFVPSGVVLPYQQMIADHGKEFISSAVAWMFMKAIDDGYKEIGLWGVEMACDAEYAYQRAGVKHFQYIAEKYHGVKVTFPASSLMAMEKEPYPFCQESQFTRFIVEKDKTIHEELNLVTDQHNMMALKAAEYKGAAEVMRLVKRHIGWPD